MQIILVASFESGQAGFAPEQIEGFDAPRRAYDVVNGQIILAGQPDAILHHDVDALLSMAGGLYRMPTPAEQETMAQVQEQASMAQESVSEGSEQEDNAPDEPPAQSKKQKASGG